MTNQAKLKCPRCGTPMNHHADKLVTVGDDADRGAIDPALGGVIQETHTCPACTNVVFRRQPARVQ